MKFICLIFLMWGCAQTQVMLDGKDKAYEDNQSTTKVLKATEEITINEFIDNREYQEVGIARTGVQYHETPVYLKPGVETYLKKSIEKQFYIRNLLLSDNGPVKLKIVLNKLWVSEVLKNNEAGKCEANITLYGTFEEASWQGNYFVEYQSKGDLGDGTEKLGPTLATCMEYLVEKLVSDNKFVNFISKR